MFLQNEIINKLKMLNLLSPEVLAYQILMPKKTLQIYFLGYDPASEEHPGTAV